MRRWDLLEGTPWPLGATWIEAEQGFNFALYSRHATEVVLLFYRDRDLVHPVLTRTLSYRTTPA